MFDNAARSIDYAAILKYLAKDNPSNRVITCWFFVSLFGTCVGSLARKSAGNIQKMKDFKTNNDSDVDVGYLTCVFTSF